MSMLFTRKCSSTYREGYSDGYIVAIETIIDTVTNIHKKYCLDNYKSWCPLCEETHEMKDSAF